MKNIACPDSLLNFSHRDFLYELLGYLENNPLDANAQIAIVNAYDIYINNRRSLESLKPVSFSPSISNEQWDSMYKSLRYRLLKRWKELLGEDNIPARCPSCGISTPTDAEHFLGRSSYREFSLLLLNLIPWCKECNNKKSTVIADQNGVRLFLNCYWDEIDKYCFWKCDVNFIQHKVIYSVTKPLGCSDNLFKIVENHAAKLAFTTRFLKPTKEEVRKFSAATEQNAKNGISRETVKVILQSKIASCAEIQGNNHWETVLYNGIYHCLNEQQWDYIVSGSWRN